MAVKMNLSFFIFATVGCIILGSVSATGPPTTTHVVGGRFGWNLPKYPGFFTDWANKCTFSVGDVLLFQYNPGLNTVIQVSKEDYDNCTTKNTITAFMRGSSRFVLNKPGEYYFISSVGKHCEAGHKLKITVHLGHGKQPSQ